MDSLALAQDSFSSSASPSSARFLLGDADPDADASDVGDVGDAGDAGDAGDDAFDVAAINIFGGTWNAPCFL